jgi:hypothetical protein
LPSPSGTNRFHNVDWWDECRVSLDRPPYANKTQKSLTVSTCKAISPQDWGTMRPSAYHKFLRTPRVTSYSSPYSKFKILIKVNFKIQAIKSTTKRI